MSDEQMPLKGIQLSQEFTNAKIYHIRCDCGDEDCSHDVEIEIDEDGYVSVNIYMKLRSKFWKVSRWKQIWQILTKGYIDTESSILLSEKSAKNYGNALLRTIDDLELRNK